MVMAPKHDPTNAELLEENRLLKHRLEDYERIRKEDAEYIRELWEDNRRVHAELRFHKQQEKIN
jgi:hypothetical protein